MSLHLQAVALYERGELEDARGTVERFLQLEALDHTQFGDGLLLLSTILCSMQLFDEAERMAATCHGYLCEHLEGMHRGVAAASLNRAIILLERYYRANDLHAMVRRHSQRRGLQRGSSSTSLQAHSVTDASGDEVSSNAVQWVVQARGHLEEAVTVLQDAFGVDRLLLADVYHNLGCCDEILGGYSDAMEYYMRSLKIREKYQDASGATDLKLAQTIEHVAMVYRLTESKLTEAQKLLAVVATTRRRYLGPLHPSYAAALFEQGVCAFEAMHLRQALTLFRKCYSIRAEVLGQTHPETFHVKKYLEELARETGWKEARIADGTSHPLPEMSSAHVSAELPRGTVQPQAYRMTTPNESVELEIQPIDDPPLDKTETMLPYYQPVRRSQTAPSVRRSRNAAREEDSRTLDRTLSGGSDASRMPPLHPNSARV